MKAYFAKMWCVRTFCVANILLAKWAVTPAMQKFIFAQPTYILLSFTFCKGVSVTYKRAKCQREVNVSYALHFAPQNVQGEIIYIPFCKYILL